jgi:hypothetical protein
MYCELRSALVVLLINIKQKNGWPVRILKICTVRVVLEKKKGVKGKNLINIIY